MIKIIVVEKTVSAVLILMKFKVFWNTLQFLPLLLPAGPKLLKKLVLNITHLQDGVAHRGPFPPSLDRFQLGSSHRRTMLHWQGRMSNSSC